MAEITKFKRLFGVLFASAALGIAFYGGMIIGDQNSRTGGAFDEDEATGHNDGQREKQHEYEFTDNIIHLSPEAKKQFTISVDRALTRMVQQAVETTGIVTADETRMVNIRPLARGRISEVYVRPGDRVEVGQALLRYDNIELGDDLGEYVATLAEIGKSNAAAALARKTLDRGRSLAEIGAISQAELLEREANYRNVTWQVEGQKAVAARIEEKLRRFGMTAEAIDKLSPENASATPRQPSYSVMRAPRAGIVTRFNAAPGASIAPEDTLLSISDRSVVWVLADIYEKDIRFVPEGQTAAVHTAAYPDRVFSGKVAYVNDTLDTQTRTAKARVEVANPAGLLKLEMFATVRLPAVTTRPALVVPSAAVHEIAARHVVFLPREDGFEPRPVTVVAEHGEWTEIGNGLREGDEVVTEGSFLLKSEALKAELGHEH